MRRGLLKIRPQTNELGNEKIKTRESIQHSGFYLQGIVIGTIVGILLAKAYENIPAGGFFGLATFMLLLFFKEGRESKKAGRVADQFDLFLVEVNGALSFGGPVMTVIKSVLDNAQEPLKSRIGLMFQQYQQGLPVRPDHNKDINIFFELIKMKETKGGAIDRSLVKLADKIKRERSQREDSATELKGSQMAILSQYGILALILAATYGQDIFKDIMIGTSGGKFIMICVSMLVCLSLFFARKVVKD